MMVQEEERMLGFLVVVQLEEWRDIFLLVLVEKAKQRVLYLVGVQTAQLVEHLGYSEGRSLASLEELGQLLCCSHMPTKTHLTFSQQDLNLKHDASW